MLKSSRMVTEDSAIAGRSGVCKQPRVALAQAILASPCGSNSAIRARDSADIASLRGPSTTRRAEKAHAMLATPCRVYVPSLVTAAAAKD